MAKPPLENGAVLVEGADITAVDHCQAFEGATGIDQEIGDSSTWLVPGFVNSHYHSSRSFQLGYSDEPGEIGLFRTFSDLGIPDPRVAGEFAYLNTLASALQLLRSGVTTTLDMAWGGRSVGQPHDPSIQSYRTLGLGLIFAPIARDRSAYVYGEDDDFLASLPASLAKRIKEARLGQSLRVAPDEYIEEWEVLHGKFADGELVHLIAALDGPAWCTARLTSRIGEWAHRHQIPIHLHNAESKLEANWAQRELGQATTAYLRAMDIIGPRTSLAHGIWVTNEDMRSCAQNGASIVHTPSSDLHWYAGIAPIVDWMQFGVNVALGTDGNGFADDNDFLAEMRMASLLQRVPGYLGWPGLSPDQVLAMATINGAKAFGMEQHVGSIEPGKRADLVLLAGDAVRGPLVNPRHNVVEVLVQRGRAEHVRKVMVAGRILFDEGQFTTVDEDQLLKETRQHYEAYWMEHSPDRDKLIEESLIHLRRFFSPWEAELLPVRYRYNCS